MMVELPCFTPPTPGNSPQELAHHSFNLLLPAVPHTPCHTLLAFALSCTSFLPLHAPFQHINTVASLVSGQLRVAVAGSINPVPQSQHVSTGLQSSQSDHCDCRTCHCSMTPSTTTFCTAGWVPLKKTSSRLLNKLLCMTRSLPCLMGQSSHVLGMSCHASQNSHL